MKNFTIYFLAALAVLINTNAKAQQALPYYSGFDSPAEKVGWQQYNLGVNATYGPWGFSNGGFSAPDCIYHDYNDTGTVEDWYVSPALTILSQSSVSLKIRTFAVMGNAIATDYIGVWYSSGSGDPNDGQFTEVAELTGLTIPANQLVWVDTTINLPFTSGSGYVAFKFKNENNWFTISIDNVTVTALVTGMENKLTENDLLIHPNPSAGKIFIKCSKKINSIAIYNLLGEKIYSTDAGIIQKSEGIDLYDYPKGIYFVKVDDGVSTDLKRIVVQ